MAVWLNHSRATIFFIFSTFYTACTSSLVFFLESTHTHTLKILVETWIYPRQSAKQSFFLFLLVDKNQSQDNCTHPQDSFEKTLRKTRCLFHNLMMNLMGNGIPNATWRTRKMLFYRRSTWKMQKGQKYLYWINTITQ